MIMRSIWCSTVAAVALTAALPVVAAQTMKPVDGTDTMHIKAPVRPLVLVDQVGYNPSDSKQAIVQGSAGDSFTSFEVIDAHDGKVVLRGTPKPAGSVDHWKQWRYWTVDFSAVKSPGWYRVKVAGSVEVASSPFRIVDRVLQRYTLSDVLYYFKGQRVSGALDQADAHLKNPLPNGPSHVDLHGGWYAATGDYSVHLTEGNDDTAFIYQEVPFVAWSMVATWRNLEATHDVDFNQYALRLVDGAAYGADFLVRDHVPGGSFYQSIDAPFQKDTDKPLVERFKRPQDRFINAANTDQAGNAYPGAPSMPGTYQASFRTGGGMAVAALAAASMLPKHGRFSNARYLQVAKNAFDFLHKHSATMSNGKNPNIVDDYCALLAATELYRATHDEVYRKAADTWADHLMARQATHGKHQGYWRAGNGDEPFFNETAQGLPVVALANYAGIVTAARKRKVREVVRRSLEFDLRITGEVSNPFGYARQLVKDGDGTTHTAFFMPHDVKGIAPWWQGEDARLASMAAAARVAAPMFADDPAFQARLQHYAWDQLHWILGRNPYDASMLEGSGHHNAEYMFLRTWQFTSAPGAIVNGITAGLDGVDDGIAFGPEGKLTGDEDWRWYEQWLPHAAWYLYAVSLPHGN